MKKIFALFISAILCVGLLSSCDSSKPYDKGSWEYDEHQHWRSADDVFSKILNANAERYDHIDTDNDGVCDICPCYVESDISKLSGITREDNENYTVFRFDNFSGSATLTMKRTGLESGVIYYTGKINTGVLSVRYDRGPWDSTETLCVFYENTNIPAENSTVGKIDQDELDFIFEATSVVSGEIIISFVPLKHEHTGEWVEYSQTTHYYQYTCGCKLPDRIAAHINKDADVFCDICGFNMYEIPTTTGYLLRSLAGCEWLNEISADDIAKIKIISGPLGVTPGSLKNISITVDETVIARIYEEYSRLEVTPISKIDGQIDGGSCLTVKFVLNDGSEKSLSLNNRNYYDTNGNYFKLLNIPKFDDSDNVTKVYGFVTYNGIGTIFDGDNNPVCEIHVSELEFYYDVDLDLPDLDPYNYVLKTEFGDLEFIAPGIFYTKTGATCVIVGKNLDELIAEYTHT